MKNDRRRGKLRRHTFMRSKAQSFVEAVRNNGIPTPVFIYNNSLLLSQITVMKKACRGTGNRYTIAYSYKTNPLLAKYIFQAGCAMQVTSLSHFEAIRRMMGNEGLKRCFFNTASLTKDVATALVASPITIVADSLTQVELLNEVGRMLKKAVPILLRVDAGITVKDTPFGTSGAVLGLSLRQAQELILNFKKYQWLEFRGIHNHAASQNTNLSSWKLNMKALQAFLLKLPVNIPLRILNLGGGYPIPYVGATPLSIHEIFSQAINPSLKSILQRFPDAQLVIEPGRFLVGPTGFLIATVTNIQSNGGSNGAVIDASLFATFNDRFLSKMTFQPTVYAARRGRMNYFIRGSSPASIDYFGTYDHLPKFHVGDTLVFGMMGAYASSMGSDFSGVTRPKEFLL